MTRAGDAESRLVREHQTAQNERPTIRKESEGIRVTTVPTKRATVVNPVKAAADWRFLVIEEPTPSRFTACLGHNQIEDLDDLAPADLRALASEAVAAADLLASVATPVATDRAHALEEETGFRIRFVPDIKELALVLHQNQLVLVDEQISTEGWSRTVRLVEQAAKARDARLRAAKEADRRKVFEAALTLAAAGYDLPGVTL